MQMPSVPELLFDMESVFILARYSIPRGGYLYAKSGKTASRGSSARIHAPERQWITNNAESSSARWETRGSSPVPELLLTVLPRAREGLEAGHREIQRAKNAGLGRARGKRRHG